MLIKAENDVAGTAAASVDPDATVPSIRPVTKQVKVNGLPTRAVELIGQVNVVLFTPDDVALVAGAPAGRRRYLDITLSQVTVTTCGRSSGTTGCWCSGTTCSDRSASAGRRPSNWSSGTRRSCGSAGISCAARRDDGRIEPRYPRIYRELGGSQHDLALIYRPTSHDPAALGDDTSGLPELYAAKVKEMLPREIEAGVSLVGPHRDDFGFLVDAWTCTTTAPAGSSG